MREDSRAAGMVVVLVLSLVGTTAARGQDPVQSERPIPQPPPTTTGSASASAPQDDEDRPPVSAASHEVLRFDCRTSYDRRDVTLFLNGTVRLRQGPPGEEKMTLGELEPARRDAVLRRLRGEDLSEAPPGEDAIEGDWVERCMLRLNLPNSEVREFHFGRLESMPLNLSRVVTIADELGGVAYERAGEHLPMGYVARPGDVLRRADGELFEVVGRSGDGNGLELQGVENPLTVYIAESELRREFVAIASRRQ